MLRSGPAIKEKANQLPLEMGIDFVAGSIASRPDEDFVSSPLLLRLLP